MRCCCSECDCERDGRPDPEIHEVRFKRHDITVSKDSLDANWYIVVTAPNGMRDYDGWWQDSATKTWRDAVVEAKRGAMLTPSTASPRS